MESANIKLEVRTQGGWHRFVVTFANQRQAIEYIERHSSVASFGEIKGTPVIGNHTRLLAILYPACHHGLGADMCMDPYGPHHFGTREQEIAMGW